MSEYDTSPKYPPSHLSMFRDLERSARSGSVETRREKARWFDLFLTKGID